MMKKVLAMLMTLLLCLGLASVAAAEEYYDIWVGGTQLSSLNTKDEGWSFDPATNTLTLSGANIQGVAETAGNTGHKGAGIYASIPLKIKLAEGTVNTVTGFPIPVTTRLVFALTAT